eukprot:6473167-Prymnesium_polylepis.1
MAAARRGIERSRVEPFRVGDGDAAGGRGRARVSVAPRVAAPLCAPACCGVLRCVRRRAVACDAVCAGVLWRVTAAASGEVRGRRGRGEGAEGWQASHPARGDPSGRATALTRARKRTLSHLPDMISSRTAASSPSRAASHSAPIGSPPSPSPPTPHACRAVTASASSRLRRAASRATSL